MDSCKICKKSFPRKYRKKGEKKLYCSKKCRYQDSYVEKKCLTCKCVFIKNKLSTKNDEYCSLSCIQRSPCEFCGEVIKGRKTFQNKIRRFCSRKCASIVNKTLSSKKKYVPFGFLVSLEKFGEICCEKCRINEIEVLCVHHKDGDRENNSKDNLITICANCHHKIHWGKGNSKINHKEIALFLLKNHNH